ncbi:bile acid:sodium symporter [Streptomyces sulfonofaciens]|uniref:Bile acid:sodium symporter n=1 Tax=Streptomyces sulfonofaciens TaxID=68272 RepID=A0A919FU32_9ACTN|nr:bile acid:sodium symporter family protein [Streptomyces sulfonofaciens]GHH71794.1 bile acid:sodium symporter [Streptomyces sulfonofaciens]
MSPFTAPHTLLRRVDRYVLALLATVGLAALLPAGGGPAEALDVATKAAVGLLFFLYGARLSRATALAGLRHWRLHLPILLCTFAVFPLLGLAAGLLPTALLSHDLATGVLFLCLLPSTVQSSVAFVSMSRGNVAAAICSASFSNLLGVLLTPALAALLLTHGGAAVRFSTERVIDIVVQLLVPFLAGQSVHRWIAPWITRHKLLTTLTDRGSILLVVYAAFSEGMNEGIWSRVSAGRLLFLAALCGVLLASVLWLTGHSARRLGFPHEDRMTVVFCAATKSLASGLPIATVLFAEAEVSLVVLPLMLYHTMQLMSCAALARRWSGTPGTGPADSAPVPGPDAPRRAPGLRG